MESPDSTAVRVALWRALHVQVDPPPHVLEDEIGLRLVAPITGGSAVRTWSREARPALRHPGVAAAGAGRLRGGLVMVGAARDRRLRYRATGGRGLCRCCHVPHQRCDRGHTAPYRGARAGLDTDHELHAPARAHRTRGAP